MNPEKISEFEQGVNSALGIAPDGKTALSFENSILSATQLDALSIASRECLVGTWWRTAALGFLFGPRGLGKTWLALHLARCLAEGRKCGPWVVPKSRRVLYIDGEMALDNLRERDRTLSETRDAPIYFLSHEHHFAKTTHSINLSSREGQRAVTDYCEKHRIEAIVIDNLSCLFCGIRENDADDWEFVLPWLMDLRRKGIAVCIVHHSGRNGANMRGTSRREDAAFWVMRLDPPSDSEEAPGACFIGRFTKNREGDESESGPWKWTFSTADGKTAAHHQHMENMEMLLQQIRDGLDSCSDIANELGVSKSTVCKWAKKAATAGKLQNRNGRYFLCEP